LSEEKESQIIELLREILKWVKFSGIDEVRTILMRTLDTEQKRLIYHLSNGENGSIEIGQATQVSNRTVTRYWVSWARLGLMEPIRVRGGLRYKKSFELEDFGFTIPQEKNIIQEKGEE
jgi:hypothetical protein